MVPMVVISSTIGVLRNPNLHWMTLIPMLLQITPLVYSSILGQMVVSCLLYSLTVSYFLLSHTLGSNTLTT